MKQVVLDMKKATSSELLHGPFRNTPGYSTIDNCQKVVYHTVLTHETARAPLDIHKEPTATTSDREGQCSNCKFSQSCEALSGDDKMGPKRLHFQSTKNTS